MLQADPSKVSSRAKKRGLPQVSPHSCQHLASCLLVPTFTVRLPCLAGTVLQQRCCKVVCFSCVTTFVLHGPGGLGVRRRGGGGSAVERRFHRCNMPCTQHT